MRVQDDLSKVYVYNRPDTTIIEILDSAQPSALILFDAYRKNVRAESMSFLGRNQKSRSLNNFKTTATSLITTI